MDKHSDLGKEIKKLFQKLCKKKRNAKVKSKGFPCLAPVEHNGEDVDKVLKKIKNVEDAILSLKAIKYLFGDYSILYRDFLTKCEELECTEEQLEEVRNFKETMPTVQNVFWF